MLSTSMTKIRKEGSRLVDSLGIGREWRIPLIHVSLTLSSPSVILFQFTLDVNVNCMYFNFTSPFSYTPSNMLNSVDVSFANMLLRI